jgi:CheY-like chemotaxis protein
VEAGQRESQRQELMIRGILSAFSGDLIAQQSSDKTGAPPPDLAACAQQAIEEFSSAFKDKGVDLRFAPPSNASSDWHVVGDVPRLDRIFGNLLENTLRYSPPNSTVTVGVEDHGESILAFVDDEGPGLPPDLPPTQLFALFSKGKSHSGKAGLGLYFCKITVERWRGTIGAETRAQGGSRFWFRLPRAAANSYERTTVEHVDSATNVARPPTAYRNPPVKTLRILVTEDTEINRDLVSELLTRRGHSVTTAADGIEALAALERNSFDAVLMDEEMPRMNGLDATRAIRKMETSTGRHLRIVGFTGNATDEDARRCLNAGMDAFIAKPVHMDKLYQAVESQPEASQRTGQTESVSDTPVPASAKQSAPEDDSGAAHLYRATGGNKKLQRSLIKTFLADAPKTLSRIRRAIAKKDAQKLASAAHALKGSIAIFGAAKAVSMARGLEAMGRSGHLFNAGPQFRDLESELARIKPELLAIFPSPKPKSKTKRKAKSRRAR